ncbi:transcriptional regulator, partial [Mycobacterium tuberculosis TKK_04_0008]
MPGRFRYLLEVLLLTDEADLESALPELESFAQSVQRAPLDDPGAAKGADADV